MESTKFSEELLTRLPDGMTLSPMLIRVMDWLEAQGGRQTEWDGMPLEFEQQSLALYPLTEWTTPGTTQAAFSYYGPFSLNGPPPVADEDRRVFLFVQTGGDGSYAGFWLDETGKQWIVHHGSGSGSDWWGVISDDPADLLRLIAIGYDEPAFRELHGKTVQEAALEKADADSLFELAHIMAEAQSRGTEDPGKFQQAKQELAREIAAKLERGDPVAEEAGLCNPPRAFQAFLMSEFGIETPERATDILSKTQSDDDPFVQWLERIQPTSGAKELARIEEMARDAEKTAAGFDADITRDRQSFLKRLRKWFAR